MIWWVEAIGIVATLLVLISFVNSRVSRIRFINMIGSAAFVVYGLLIHSLSVWLLNGVMILVNGYKLYKLHRSKNKEVGNDGSPGVDA